MPLVGNGLKAHIKAIPERIHCISFTVLVSSMEESSSKSAD